MKWQTIDSAPKDRLILLWYGNGLGLFHKFVVGQWHPDQYWVNDYDHFLGNNWCKKNSPTHWIDVEEPQ